MRSSEMTMLEGFIWVIVSAFDKTPDKDTSLGGSSD